MKKLIMLLSLTGIGCSDFNVIDNSKIVNDRYISVAKAIITVKQGSGSDSVLAAPSQSVTVSYIQPEIGTLQINVAGILPALSGDILDLGNIEITNIDINKLRVCGTGSQKCTSAVIRTYTTGSAISGFVNTDFLYGLDLFVNGSNLVGLTSPSAVILDSYTIPGNVNKLRTIRFNNLVHEYVVDFSNGGFGNYETQIVLDIGLAL